MMRLLLAASMLCPPSLLAGADDWVALTYAQAPADNPLKGFLPYQGAYSHFPHSMEWQSLPWSSLQTGPDSYDWTAMDNLLNDVASRGHQAVFRIYADYPTRPYAVPSFLSHVPKRAYTDYGNATSHSPDYDNADLKAAMLNMIAALGARYDGDPRIGFVTIGFVGFWGEWHTYRDSCGCDTWMPSTATQNAILTAFDNAFNRTRILLRTPKGSSPAMNIGYHDDSFNHSTYGATAWYFWPLLTSAGLHDKWRTEPIGGELRPGIQRPTWKTANLCVTGATGDLQCFNTSVDTTHASWMLAHELFSPGNSGTERARAIEGARRMGYELFVAAVRSSDISVADPLQLQIKLQNRGVAPFYYDWKVQLGVANSSGQVMASLGTDWKLSAIVDGSDHLFSFSRASHGLPPGSYKLLMRVVNPLANGKPLQFANAEWNRDVTGWLTLRTFSVLADRDVDGLPDEWEATYFGTLALGPRD